jgi:tight adherence protein C
MGGLIVFITDPSNLLSILVGVAVFATILTITKPMMGGARLDKRMRSVAQRRDELKRRSRQALKGQQPSLRNQEGGFKQKIVDRFNLAKHLEDPNAVDKMAQAGFRGAQPITTFYFFRLSLPFLFMLLAAIYLFFINDLGQPVVLRLCMLVFPFAAGFYMPNIFLENRIAARRQSIVQAFPDSLDLLLICVESGMSIEAAIQKVSQEVGTQSIELAEELSLLSAELSYLPDRRMAYEGLSRRVNHPGIRAVATAMTQAETYGTPLGNALRIMAKENRDLRLAAAEKKAAALPAKLTVPMIIFFLPVLFAVILGPAIMSVMDIMKS